MQTNAHINTHAIGKEIHKTNVHKRRTSECTHIDSDGIILQKGEHSHAYTHTFLWPQEKKHTNENGHERHTSECNHIRSDGIILQKKGTAMHTHTHNTRTGMRPKE